jgi:hypothetical protein
VNRTEERAIKDEIIAAYVQQHGRGPSSDQVWFRFRADPRVIAHQARAIVELAALKQFHQAMGVRK